MKLQAVAAAAAVLIAGSTAAAFAQTTAPVAVIDSQAQPQIQDAERNTPGLAAASFVNNNLVAATEVDFLISSNGAPLATIRDTGIFSPNVVVRHVFTNDQTARDQQLSIARVKFADGSEWVNGDPLPAGQLAVHPWMTTPE